MPIDEFVNKVHCGNVVDILKLLPSNSVDCVCTSPPYWGLRSYPETELIWGGDSNCKHEWSISGKPGTKLGIAGHDDLINTKANRDKVSNSNVCVKCGAFYGQLGLEPHPNQYIEHLVEIFREVKRILKNSGSLFLNIGDTYYGSEKGIGGKLENSKEVYQLPKGNKPKYDYDGKWLQRKQQLMIPERVAIELQNDGWIKRNTIIWSKKNAMPDSCKDRFNYHSFESIFFFTKNPRYYSDLDNVRLPHIWAEKDKRSKLRRVPHKTGKAKESKTYSSAAVGYNPCGKNPGSVWTINTKPCKEAHFASFPPKLVQRILKFACPKEVCSKCGKPRKRITKKGKALEEWKRECGADSKGEYKGQATKDYESSKAQNASDVKRRILEGMRERITVGWTKCKCNAEFKAGIVLDPFIGSGTTGMVAKQMGLNFIGIELNREYCSIADKRIGGVEIVEYPVNREKYAKFIEEKNIKVYKPLREGSKCNYSGKCMWKSFSGEECLRKDSKCLKGK